MAQIKKIGIYPNISVGVASGLISASITPELLANSENSPTQIQLLPNKVSRFWVFKGIVYEADGIYTTDQIILLVLDAFDKERRLFERLKHRYETGEKEETYKRIPIPEAVRIEVWRRDGGKCAKCGSRENLEYDHIVPVSKGGSNTARNIELLCEPCNRSKGARIG